MQVPTTIDGLRKVLQSLGFGDAVTGMDVMDPDAKQHLMQQIAWQHEQSAQNMQDNARKKKALSYIERFPWPDMDEGMRGLHAALKALSDVEALLDEEMVLEPVEVEEYIDDDEDGEAEAIIIKRAAMALTEANKLLARRTKAKRILAFHGTSNGKGDRILKGILKKGLNPGAKKVWEDDPDAGWYQQSRASYGGTYFTTNIGTAKQAAGNAHRKLGGDDMVIVTALVQPRSALPDEDSYVSMVQGGVAFALQANINEYGAPRYYINDVLGKYDDEKTKYHEFIAKRLSQLQGWPEKHAKKATLRKVTDAAFSAQLKRLAGHLDDQYWQKAINEYKDDLGWDKGLRYYDIPDSELPKALQKKPTKQEGEQAFRDAVDLLTRMTKRSALALEGDRFLHSFRMMEPVAFRGRNRIISVVSVPGYYDNKKSPHTMVVHYGDPAEVHREMEKSWGSPIQLVRPGEEPQKLAAKARKP